MSKSVDVVLEYEDGFPREQQSDCHEEGVEVPLGRINSVTLRNLITEFVTRESEELGDSGYTLDEKIKQVHRQLLEKKADVLDKGRSRFKRPYLTAYCYHTYLPKLA